MMSFFKWIVWVIVYAVRSTCEDESTTTEAVSTLDLVQRLYVMDCLVCTYWNIKYCCEFPMEQGRCCSDPPDCPARTCAENLFLQQLIPVASACPSRVGCYRKFSIFPVCCLPTGGDITLLEPLQITSAPNRRIGSLFDKPDETGTTTLEMPSFPVNVVNVSTCSLVLLFQNPIPIARLTTQHPVDNIRINSLFECEVTEDGMCHQPHCSVSELRIEVSVCPWRLGCMSFTPPNSTICCLNTTQLTTSSKPLGSLS